MKPITPLLMALLAAAFLAACSPQSLPPQDGAKTAAQEAQPLAEAPNEPAEEIAQKIAEPAAEVKEAVEKPVAAVKEEAGAIAEEVKVSATATAEKGQPVAAPAAPAISRPASPAPQGPGVVAYEASMGKVTFYHGVHASQRPCSACHPSDPPGKIVLGKEIAHTLCKGCHKTSGVKAPTACTGCHKK